MLFAKFAVLASLATSAFAGAAVQRMERHQRSLVQRHGAAQQEISTILIGLKTEVDIIGGELAADLDALVKPTATQVAAVVIPAVQAIIKEVSAVVTTLTTAKSSLDLDINIDQVASDLVAVINAVLVTLTPVEQLIVNLPLLGALLFPVLSALNVVLGLLLSIVSVLLSGVLALVHNLLDGVAGLLTTLGLRNVVSLLGI